MESNVSPGQMNIATYFVLVVTLATLGLSYKFRTNPLAHIPGPYWSRITSFPLKIAILQGKRTTYVHELHQRYGRFVRISPDEVSFADVDVAKVVYKMGTPFLKGRWYINFSGMFKQQNIFSTTDSKVHGHHRRLTARSFAEGWVGKMEPYIAKNVDLTVDKMASEMSTQGYCDVYKWFTFMATDIIGEASFGESFRTLESGEKTQYTHDLERETQRGILRSVSPLLASLPSLFPFLSPEISRGSSSNIYTYADQSLSRYWNALRRDPDTVIPTLLTKSYASLAEGSISHEQLRLDAVGYIVAGTDTTALAATQAVWHLSQAPEVERELIGALAGLPEGFTDAELQRVPLLQWVVNETLRLKPSVSEALPRVVPRGGAELGGYYVPEGATVGIPPYTLHRDPVIWEAPEEFRPERWRVPTVGMRGAYLPFGGGSRVCIGSHFAQLELRHALARFYRRFPKGMTMSKLDGFGKEDMEVESFFLLLPKGRRCLLECRA